MDKKKRWKQAWVAIAIAMGLTACTVDEYKTGDGKYSYLRADFGMLHTTSASTAYRLVTDEGKTIDFDAPTSVTWATKPDSVYRALVYYDASSGRLFSASQVPVVYPRVMQPRDTVHTDPLTIESVWVAGGYLNIGFAVKSGQATDIGMRRQIGLMHEGMVPDAQGRQTLNIRVFHDQNGLPEYYTVRGYMSMPITSDMKGNIVRLSANTYKGEVVRTIQP